MRNYDVQFSCNFFLESGGGEVVELVASIEILPGHGTFFFHVAPLARDGGTLQGPIQLDDFAHPKIS